LSEKFNRFKAFKQLKSFKVRASEFFLSTAYVPLQSLLKESEH